MNFQVRIFKKWRYARMSWKCRNKTALSKEGNNFHSLGSERSPRIGNSILCYEIYLNVSSQAHFCLQTCQYITLFWVEVLIICLEQKLPPIQIKKSTKEHDSDDEHVGSLERVSSLDRRHAHVRTLSTRRVCWHRNTSISMNEYKMSVQVWFYLIRAFLFVCVAQFFHLNKHIYR